MVNPVTIRGEAGPLALKVPGLQVAVWPVMGEPPLVAGGVKAMVA